MQKITDIWFITNLDIQKLAGKIGLLRTHWDYENELKWITGYINDYYLDITRPHSVEPSSTDTRIFLLGEFREFDRQLIEQIVRCLDEIDVRPIYLGSWGYIGSNGFKKVIVETIN